MSNYTSLNAYINANIKQNGKREITGQILNSVLNAMVNTLGAGYQFAGVATPASNPGTPDAKVFYIANGKGIYTNFGGIDVTEDEVVVLYYDTEWHKVSTGIASQAKLSELQTTIDSKQDTISDLDDIREGAELGKTALQEHQDISGLATKKEVATKQDKISDLATIREGAAKGATALQSYTETDPIYTADKPSIALKSEIPDISGKQDKISDLDTIRSGAAKGATALQSYTETDPIYSADKPSLALKSELDGKQDKLTAGDNITIVNNVISSTGGGGGSVDLSAYAKTVDVNAGLATKQDKLIAGNGIIIEQNVISATGGGGGGSVDLSAYAKKEDVDAALEGKQDTIADLDAIRQGAQKGSTALQSESDPVYLADKPKLALKVEIPDVSGKVDKVVGKGLSSNDYTDADKLKLAGLENYDDTQIRELIAGKANLQHQHTVADITDFPELYYDATAFLTSGAYPSDRYEELLDAVKAKKTVYATLDEDGNISYVFFTSLANSDASSSRVLLTAIFVDGSYLYLNTFVLQQSGMTRLQENITGKANKATTLAGYGIGDAYTKSEVDAAISSAITTTLNTEV